MSVRSITTTRLVVSVDVEDWPQSTWDHTLEIMPRAAENTERVLDILAMHGQAATMFVLGKFAERFPATIKRMAREGHEVASHGYGHIRCFGSRQRSSGTTFSEVSIFWRTSSGGRSTAIERRIFRS